MNWQTIKNGYSERRRQVMESLEEGALKYALIALAVYALAVVVIAGYWSSEPEQFSVLANAEKNVSEVNGRLVIGSVTTSTLIKVTTTLLDKPGGFLSNDLFPPGVLLDDIPQWEYGVLIQVRDLSKVMREHFSRSKTQSTENKFLLKAEPSLNFSNASWAVPATESEYRYAVGQLKNYLASLDGGGESGAQFYARADNLNNWLQTIESRLGSLSQRLSASVIKHRINTDLAGAVDAKQSTHSQGELTVKTPWLKIDDVFYESRGASWALIHFLKAVEIDFSEILDNKNAKVSLQQIIRELEGTQAPIYSPMILNGSGFGFLANHSLVMASYISRANAGIIELRELLSKG